MLERQRKAAMANRGGRGAPRRRVERVTCVSSVRARVRCARAVPTKTQKRNDHGKDDKVVLPKKPSVLTRLDPSLAPPSLLSSAEPTPKHPHTHRHARAGEASAMASLTYKLSLNKGSGTPDFSCVLALSLPVLSSCGH